MKTTANAITPTNSPTAYHCTLPDCRYFRTLPVRLAVSPAPLTMPSITVRSNQATTWPSPLASVAAPFTMPSITTWLNQFTADDHVSRTG